MHQRGVCGRGLSEPHSAAGVAAGLGLLLLFLLLLLVGCCCFLCWSNVCCVASLVWYALVCSWCAAGLCLLDTCLQVTSVNVLVDFGHSVFRDSLLVFVLCLLFLACTLQLGPAYSLQIIGVRSSFLRMYACSIDLLPRLSISVVDFQG